MDWRKEEITYMLDVSADFKRQRMMKEPHEYLRGRTVAMIFEKHSTRTRFSFQAAIAHLGMQSFYATPDVMQLARGEPVKDTARIIDRYCDGLVLRTYGQNIAEEYAEYMDSPVINALTDLTHPCQGLADMLTMRERKGRLQGLKVAYVGDPWNVCHSLMVGSSIMGMDMYVAVPKGWKPNEKITKFAVEHAADGGSQMIVTDDLEEAFTEADVVYANTYHSMGHKDIEERKKAFAKYQVNDETMRLAKRDAIFMHCLPGYRGEEMTDSVIEGPQSAVWDEGENRMHTEKAVLALFIQ
ncbi:ornithine carbamoyltransferase [Candidatus Bathyarchaeota archaeon RBG_16_57_9]|nr:MAG: ornithine carbamoyltransferase [Candidatus Bathyarchaeota archaeon RBG_16_57_9]OGD53112.1 MAG: ornithine carbamoyltransferase [Candidatus Bathyarchaeota archaeon RBG_13_60_20]